MAIQSETSELVTPREAAKMLYIHINTLRRWGNEGIIKQYRIGLRGDRRFSRKEVFSLIQRLHDNGGYL